MEAKLDDMSEALKSMQQMMTQKGYFTEEDGKGVEGKKNKDKSKSNNITSASETTINQNVAPQEGAVMTENENDHDSEVILNFSKQKQTLNSSSDQVHASGEILNVTEQFIADCAAEAERRRFRDTGIVDQLVTSPQIDRAELMLKEAEAFKARILQQGNVNVECSANYQAVETADKQYLVTGTHIDNNTKQKIFNHQYVDFAKLLPRDWVSREEDHRMEIISKRGSTYFVPISDRESVGIYNFSKWEQAFRVFSDIYTRYFPDRAAELLQYNHIIFTASQSFHLDNVYQYDKEFRMHLSNFPSRSWAIILQQAWSIYLRDKIKTNDDGWFIQMQKYKKEICKCTAGASCAFDHCCLSCKKWGPGLHICRNRKQAGGNSPGGVTVTPGHSNVATK